MHIAQTIDTCEWLTCINGSGGYDKESQLCLDYHDDVFLLMLSLSQFRGIFGSQKKNPKHQVSWVEISQG